MKQFKFISLALIAGFISPKGHTDFELGYQYYQVKQFEKAYNEFLTAAELGDKDAQLNLGIMHYRGEFVPKSLPKAYAWLNLANQPTMDSAEKTLAAVSKKMTPVELAEGAKELAGLNTRFSEVAVWQRLTPITEFGGTPVESVKALKQAVPNFTASQMDEGKFGSLRVSFTVARDGSVRDMQIITPNITFENNIMKALRQWQFSPALEQGKPINSYGKQVKFNFALGPRGKLKGDVLQKSLQESHNKALNGTPQDKIMHAIYTESVEDVVKGIADEDTQKAKIHFDNPTEWYFKAAREGAPLGEFQVGLNMLSGKMCTQNTRAGLGWLERAASKGLADAQFQLGALVYEGHLAPRDTFKGLYWLDKASSAGFANASLKLAWYYATSEDPSLKDSAKAQNYLARVKDTHPDQLTYWETTAAVAAANGQYPAAIKAQKKAQNLASDYGLNLPTQQAQLEKYQASSPWISPF